MENNSVYTTAYRFIFPSVTTEDGHFNLSKIRKLPTDSPYQIFVDYEKLNQLFAKEEIEFIIKTLEEKLYTNA